MKRKPSISSGSNFWPGYVDAMVNVVLNLLFLVAMFAISAAVLGSGKGTPPLVHSPQGDAHQAPVGGWATAAPPGNGAESLVTSRSTQPSDSREVAQPSQVVGQQRSKGRDTGRDEVVYATEPHAVGALKPAEQGNNTVAQPLRPMAPTLSNAQSPKATPANLGRYEPPSAQSAPQPTVSLQVADAHKALGTSRARITRRDTAEGRVFMIDLPLGAEPIEELARPQMVATLRNIAPVSERQQLMLWTYASSEDAQMRRTAYLALASLRNALVGQGWSPRAIDTQLAATGQTTSQGGVRLYLVVRQLSASEPAALSLSQDPMPLPGFSRPHV